MANKFKEIDLLGPAYIASAIGILLYLLPNMPWQLLIIVPLASIPNGLQQANFSAFLIKRTDEKVRGEVLGINASVNSLGQSLPPLLAGAIAAVTASYVPIIISSLVVLSAGLVFIYKVKNSQS